MMFSIGDGLISSSVVHTLGQATLNRRSTQQDNDFHHVMPVNGYATALKTQEYLNEVIQR